MIRLTIVALIADLPWSKNRPGVAKETTTEVPSQGKLGDYYSFGRERPAGRCMRYGPWSWRGQRRTSQPPRSEAGVEHPAGRDLTADRATLVGADPRLLQIETAHHDAPSIAVQSAGHWLGAPREHVLAVEGLPRRQGRPQLAAPAEQARFIRQDGGNRLLTRDTQASVDRRRGTADDHGEHEPRSRNPPGAGASDHERPPRLLYTNHFPLARRRGCMQSLAGQGGLR